MSSRITSPRQFLHLKPLKTSQVPIHPLLQTQQTPSCPSLRTFLTQVLHESIVFSEQTVSAQFKPKGGQKKSKGAASLVQLLTWEGEQSRSNAVAEAGRAPEDEHWFARQSDHEDSKEQGQATWQEFQNGLFFRHSEHEMDYTPDGL